jgi:hypothetical protein
VVLEAMGRVLKDAFPYLEQLLDGRWFAHHAMLPTVSRRVGVC